MICPKCGDELRRSKKDPSYGLCDSCRKKYKWIEEEHDDYEEEEISLDDDDAEPDDSIRESRRLTKRTPPAPPVKKKKNGLKVFLIIFILLIVAGLAFAIFLRGIGILKPFNKPEDNTENVQPDENPDLTNDTNSADDETDQTIDSQAYNSGTYVVGTDIPAGEYVLIADMNGYFERAADTSGEIDSISANSSFTTNTIVTISEGEYFIFSSAVAYPIDQAPELDTTQQGMFKVGRDIEAGEYTIHSDGSGTVEISLDSTHDITSTFSKEAFEGEKTITVSDGQYLTLTDAFIVQ